MDVRSVPPQTIVFGEVSEPSGLRDLLALCDALGLQVVSVQRLPHRTGGAGPPARRP
jgi:hypothetical protein